MKNITLLCSILLLAGVSMSGTALADRGHGGHGHVGIGLYFGAPYLYPYYPPYYYPYPYYPPVMVAPAPAQPPVYIEQQAQPPSQVAPTMTQQAVPDNYYWYHCDKPEGYYPYVKECPGGWQKVTPTPPQP